VLAADQQNAWVSRAESLRRTSKDGPPFAAGPSLGREHEDASALYVIRARDDAARFTHGMAKWCAGLSIG